MSSTEDRVNQLEAENRELRAKLAELEAARAAAAAVTPAHPVLTSLEWERRHHAGGGNGEGADTKAEAAAAAPSPSAATRVVTFDGSAGDPHHPSSVPIYQTATFVLPGFEGGDHYDYTRSGNPTRKALQDLVAELEGAAGAFAFTSGMAALQTLVTTLAAGDVVLASSDLYGGMHRLLTQITATLGIEVVLVDTWDLAAVGAALESHPRARLLHLESPTNPLMRIVDIAAVCELAHARGVKVSIDNTMMSPVRCTPLALGCDYSVHSATKFLCGHSDTMCGVVCARTPELAQRIAFLQNAQGNALAPFDSWLLLRGLKTLAIRVERQELNAVAAAMFLARQTGLVRRLHYAGLNPAHFPRVLSITPGDFALHARQTSGPGSVISIETGDEAVSRAFVSACRLFKLTVSFGSCNSVIELPCLFSHASIRAEERTLPADLIRLAVGIEDARDILADLARAVTAATGKPPQ